jgi:hypothetical protein
LQFFASGEVQWIRLPPHLWHCNSVYESKEDSLSVSSIYLESFFSLFSQAMEHHKSPQCCTAL